MLTKDMAFSRLSETAKTDKKHEDYTRVTDLAKKYKAFSSGIGIESYLKQFQKRESKEDFEQRCALTIYTTSSVWEGLNKPKVKIATTKPIVNELRYAPENDTAKKELTMLVDNFYGTYSLNYWLKHVFLQWEDTDPNAWVIITFDDFDARFEKPVAYATIIKSEDAVDFDFKNNVLQYLTVKKFIQYDLLKSPGKTAKGAYYLIYASNDQIEFTQIDSEKMPRLKDGVLVDAAGIDVLPQNAVAKIPYYYRTDKKKLWQVVFYEPKSERVPAFRVGEIYDKATDGRTRVSLIHPAMPYLEEILKTGSEFDINMSMHAFMQKITYAPPCQGSDVGGVRVTCNDGYTPQGTLCDTCKGTGVIVHTSGQDMVTLRLPKRPEEAFTLSNLATYISMPIEILKTLDDYIEKCERKSYQTVYNSDTYVQGQITDTATGKIIDKQSEYDAIAPVASRYSFAYKFIVEQIAIYNNMYKGLVVAHQFPSNFHFESVPELINKLNAAKTAGASEFLIRQINDEIVALAYQDQPEKKKELEVKAMFNPFDGKSEMMIQTILANDWTTHYNKTLWLFFKEIFLEAEMENKGFYEMTYAKQKAIIDVLVEKYEAEIEEDKAPDTPDTPEGAPAEYNSVDEVNAAFVAGDIEQQAAVDMLVSKFSYAEADAVDFLTK